MNPDLLQLSKDLIAIQSESQMSNSAVSDFLEKTLKACAFEVERLSYLDAHGKEKISLVAKKGDGRGGFGLFSHSDTVPGEPGEWSPYEPMVKDGRLIGRGSCDMKGPLAATIVAASRVDAAHLRRPLYLAIAADEEIGYGGAFQVATESELFKANWPERGIIAEPTRLRPVYAHKGWVKAYITAYGRAAHTSIDQGVSANFLIAPFLAAMAELKTQFKTDERYFNHQFTPPTNGFNMVIDDGGCKPNVTAAKTVCTLSLRTTAGDRSPEIIDLIEQKAQDYDLSIEWELRDPFAISPEAEIIQAAIQATGLDQAETVPYGTEAAVYKNYLQLVILGPGNIDQAHTVGEWIDLAQLEESVGVYQRMIETFCMA